MTNCEKIFYSVYCVKTLHGVDNFHPKEETASRNCSILNNGSNTGQYATCCAKFVADPRRKDRWLLVDTEPAGITFPITPPPQKSSVN